MSHLSSSFFSRFSLSKNSKKKGSYLSLGFLCALGTLGYAQAQQQPVQVKDTSSQTEPKDLKLDKNPILDGQFYTGSLLSPSGAVSQAGMLMVEPYVLGTISRGEYLPNGNTKHSRYRTDSMGSFILVKYGITNRLTVQITPQFNYYWNGKTTASSVHFNDLPVELQYRLIDQVDSRYQPSVTAYLGMNFPTGDYSRLGRSLDDAGAGVYALRFGLQTQSAYEVFNRALRVRTWGVARKGLSSVNIHDISHYGTSNGYDGNAGVGLFGNAGFSLEYGLSEKWVLSFDAQYDWAQGTRMRGAYVDGPFIRNITGASHDWQIAPAVEYNFTSNVGLIVGTAFSVDGHNTNNFVQPQAAVSITF